MNVDYPGAIPIWVPESDLFTTNTHQAIVIHKTAGGSTPQQIAQYFINASPGPSVHYIIGLDGTIVQCAPEALGAGGNCCLEAGHDPFWNQFGGVNLNTVTLSIEHVDPSTDNSTLCPRAQIDASFKLVLHLAEKYHIAPDHIKPHSSLDPISRARCPGNYPFADLITYVQNGGNNVNIQQSAKDCWNSTAHLFAGTSPSYASGIALAWQALYAKGKKPGPPLTPEYGSVDWNGKSIRVQEFANTRCEWDGQPHWYPQL